MFFNKPANPNNTKLYDILNVSKGCSEDELKKSYKKLAMKYHPDRSKEEGAEEKFKEISRAYNILNNKEKREIYDSYGEEGLNRNMSEQQMPNMDPFGMFGNMFNMNNRSRQQTKTKDRKEEIEISLEDAYKEKKMKLSYEKQIICSTCRGEGVKDKSLSRKCQTCKGMGKVLKMVQLGPGFVSQSQVLCNECRGSGKYNPADNICMSCNGEKIVKTRNSIKINLKRDFKNGHTLKFSGESDQHPDADVYGDLFVKINIAPHKIFKIHNDVDLIIDKKITLVEALCGCEFVIEHLDGEKLYVKNTDVIQPFSKKVIRKKGMTGDLIINFNVVFPTSIDDERRKYIQELFKKYEKTEKLVLEGEYTKTNLEEYKENNREQRKEKLHRPPDDNENVECVHQ